ncbi:Cytochrome P450 [Macleaya cordata]|uniref:N-methylcoclaurine 3'-monooxygenase n=1 Tax=Macleaya cordata TaxID=56857 RepID=A0A200RDP4_MACCD|nr:Cytochrome P450 [Macleaya cordata]
MSPAAILKWVVFVQQDISLQTFSLSVLFVFMLLILMFRFNRANDQKRKLNLPPSPPNKLPILGHLHQLGTHPHRNLQILAQKHGPDLMLLHLGHAPTLVVTSAESAREIMKTHDHVFASRPASYINFSTIRTWLLHHIVSTGNRCAGFAFFSFLVQREYNRFGRVAFGRKYSGDHKAEVAEKKFGEIVKDVIHLLGVFNVGDFIPWLAWVNNFNGLNRKLEKTFQELDGFLEVVVEDHINRKDERSRSSNGGGGGEEEEEEEEEDLVDVLLGIENDGSIGVSLGRDNIKAIISVTQLGFPADMAADQPTTFKLGWVNQQSVWAMAELLRYPKIMKEVQEEVRGIAKGKPNVTENDLVKMLYLQSVIKETLRLHPPATLLLPHESIELVKLQGYDIPANTRVIINAWAIGRNPISWREPEKFEPKRFMSSSIDYKGQHFQFIPFGAGRRGCPGTLFAISSIELGLANLLYRYDWKLPDGAREDELDMAESGPGSVTHMKSPLLVIATDHLYT